MSLRTLPLELKLKTIAELKARDILHLEQSCKSMYELIEGSPDVWKSLLKRLCASEKWIWASYDDLSTAFEFKNACVRSTRFIKLVCDEDSDDLKILDFIQPFASTAIDSRSSSSGGHLSQLASSSPVTFQREFASTALVYLVPGGRFFVTVNAPSLFLWDLRRPAFEGSTSRAPSILSRHDLFFQKSPVLVLAEVINASTVIILFEETEPEGEVMFRSSFELVEIQFTAGDPPSIRTLGRLRVLFPLPNATTVAIYHDRQVFIHIHRTTLAWKYHQKCYSMWNVGDAPDVSSDPSETSGQWTYSILARQANLLYIGVRGVHGLPFPDDSFYRAIQDDEVPSRRPSQILEVPFAFSIPHPLDIAGSPEGACVTVLRNISNTGPVIYGVGETDYSEFLRTAFALNLYHLHINPADPSTSTVRLAGSSVIASTFHLEPLHNFPCGPDKVGFLWSNPYVDVDVDENATIHISITRFTSTATSAMGPASTTETSSPAVIESTLKETIKWSRSPGVPRVYSLCAATGRLAVLWDLEDPENDSDRLLEVYDFL